MNRESETRRGFWTGISPWMVIGAVGVLLPLFVFMVAVNINRQKQSSVRLLEEKGAALIRAFEAGTRTGMMGGGNFQLQRLLIETAQQPDIAYLFVADGDSRIVAHSDPSFIGTILQTDLDLAEVVRQQAPRWRLVETAGGRIFEVFRRFLPEGYRRGGMHRMMMNRGRFEPGHPPPQERLQVTPRSPGAIFIGLDMTTVEEARRADARHTVLMAVILLLIGFAGVVLLFMAQGYRSTREALTQVRAFSDHLVQHMPMALVAIDERGHIVSFNRVAGKILQVAPERAVGAAAGAVLPEPLLQVIETGSEVGSGGVREIECPAGPDRVVPLEVSASVLRSDDGASAGSVVLFRDRSEMRDLRREVARTQRLASVGRLAGGVAHEVRNPLSSIKGFATYFKERYRDAPEDLQIADLMIGEVERTDRVIGQLLDFARPIRLKPAPVDVAGLLADSLKLVETKAMERRVRLQLETHQDVGAFSLDGDRVRQVLLNLYLNALDAMENGGTLAVSVDPAAERAGLSLRVSDTGVGIADADLAHVFDPYYTTKSSGTGLGLAIAHNIMEAHGGEIRIESRSGQGTTAVLFFPDRSPAGSGGAGD